VKLACVVHRFGADIAGGSEGHCRLVAEQLAASHDVTVLTTTARDHVTWANRFAPGESAYGGAKVHRFTVDRQRDLHRFRDLSARIAGGRAAAAEEEQWFAENGPRSSALLDYLQRRGREYDLILFWAYRYAHSYFGLPLVRERAVLVPTAEDDPLVHASVLTDYFALPRGVLFLTPEEETLIGDLLPRSTPRVVVGCGVDPPPTADRRLLQRFNLPDCCAVYVGRIDPNKGCTALFEYFAWYAASHPEIALVLAGPANMPIPRHPAIRHLGYVDDRIRDALLAHARVLIQPSRYESLSLVLLEAWNHGTPALVNARCAVLKGQVERADGGLHYRDRFEFAAALDYLLAHPDVGRKLGAQGREYVDREYRWPTVMSKIEALLNDIAGSARAPQSC
jgi:glycosyltransferase involved in cell wall biosynthesis